MFHIFVMFHLKLTLLETDHCWQIRVRLGLRIFEFFNMDVILLLLFHTFDLKRDPALMNLVATVQLNLSNILSFPE